MAYNEEAIYHTLHLIGEWYDAVAQENTATATAKMELLSKLALLELGGWIEMTVDQILLDYVTTHIHDTDEQLRIKADIVDKVHGFDPHAHFWPLFEHILGVKNFIGLKAILLEKHKYHPLDSELTILAKHRNTKAHTYHTGGGNPTQSRFNSPSAVLASFTNLYPGIEIIKEFIGNL